MVDPTTVHDIRKALEDEVAAWEKFNNPCALSRFVLRNGVVMAGHMRPPGVRKRESRECFRNATRAVLYGRYGYEYYEGLGISSLGVPIHHAWCVSAEGKVVDLTWLEPEDCSYMGVHIPKADLSAQVKHHGMYGVIAGDVMGFNVKYIFGRDPELKTICEAILARRDVNNGLPLDDSDA
jgi:hypothetical protein